MEGGFTDRAASHMVDLARLAKLAWTVSKASLKLMWLFVNSLQRLFFLQQQMDVRGDEKVTG